MQISAIGRLGKKNAAPRNNIGAVSPAPRLIARIVPVKMPGRACGRTTFLIVCHFVAPSPYDASLWD